MIPGLRERNIRTGIIQAVIFDLDGVLLDSEWLSFIEWKKLVKQYGGKLADPVFHELIGTTAEETSAIIMRHTGVVFDIEATSALIWQRVTERLQGELEPLPGAREVVNALIQRGYPLGIASNSLSDYIDNALNGLGMRDCFPVQVSREQVAEGKPAPDVYLLAAEKLGTPPERCLAIEDSRVGVQAAVNAGMRVIAVPGPNDHSEGFSAAWRVFPSLSQVNEELDKVLS